jgi:hypothetical protein
MALNAQQIADALAKQGIKGMEALQAFDSRFSLWYVGAPMNSYTAAAHIFGELKLNGGNLVHAELPAKYRGDGGFPEKLKDKKNPGEDQTHHFAAYLSAGINGMYEMAKTHMYGDQDNPGDIALSQVAYPLGEHLRNNPDDLNKIGKLIYTNVCLGKGGSK